LFFVIPAARQIGQQQLPTEEQRPGQTAHAFCAAEANLRAQKVIFSK